MMDETRTLARGSAAQNPTSLTTVPHAARVKRGRGQHGLARAMQRARSSRHQNIQCTVSTQSAIGENHRSRKACYEGERMICSASVTAASTATCVTPSSHATHSINTERNSSAQYLRMVGLQVVHVTQALRCPQRRLLHPQPRLLGREVVHHRIRTLALVPARTRALRAGMGCVWVCLGAGNREVFIKDIR